MTELLERLDENEAKLRLLKQDVDRIKINPLYSLSIEGDALRKNDLTHVANKMKRTLVRRYNILTKVADGVLKEMEQITNRLKELKA